MGPAGWLWTLAGIPGADAASHRGGWPGQCGQPVPRLQARLTGRRSAGLATRARGERCRPGSRGRGPERHGGWTRLAGRLSPPPGAPALRRRPARPPGTRPRSVAAAPRRAGHRQACAHLAPSERLCGSCTRGSGSGSGCPARGSGSVRTRTTSGARVPRQDGLRAAPLPRRRHAPPRPSAGLRRAAAHPPRTGRENGRPRRSAPPPGKAGIKASTSQRLLYRERYWAPVGWQVTCRFSS